MIKKACRFLWKIVTFFRKVQREKEKKEQQEKDKTECKSYLNSKLCNQWKGFSIPTLSWALVWIKYVQVLTVPDFESEFWDPISSSATTLLCIFKDNVLISVLNFPSYFTNNANSVNSQSILEHNNMSSDLRYWDASIHSNTPPFLICWTDLEIHMTTAVIESVV